MLIQSRRAQSTLEYALLIAVVVGALLWMQNYLKRAIQGRMRQSSEEIGEQYSPGLTSRSETINMKTAKVEENTTRGFTNADLTIGSTKTVVTGGQQDSKVKTEIRPLDQEVWKQ